jgi:sulfite reductase (NADPH) flavoprotein alpha-component
MSINVPPPASIPQIIPETAPFSSQQRQWLNGFFAGMLALDAAAPASLVLAPSVEDETPPWHDAAMPLADRMALAQNRPVAQKLYAAMAQQNCGQCGYLCKTYSEAIAEGKEARLNLCAPGGKETFRMLKTLVADLGAPALDPADAAIPAPSGVFGYCREKPAEAIFLGRSRLNAPNSEKATFHLKFDLSNSGITYEAGDSMGVFVQNDPALVDAVLGQLGANPAEIIEGISLRDHLIENRALGPVPDALFQLFSMLTGGAMRAKARALANGEDPDGDLDRLDVFGALFKFRQVRLGAEAFLEALDPLQPRLYSISSSPKTRPGEVTLTVDRVGYQVGVRPRLGVASTFLADRAQPGDPLKVYIQKAHGFGLPSDPATPIIMVGPGTGIAPFRAFLEERRAIGASGKNWLFYGHQRVASDFFYADELNFMQESGLLTRLSLAWSRDGAEKFYVQDRLRESGRMVWAWLNEGAHVYICGDAKRMARDVERALVDIAAVEGKQSPEEAALFVAGLKKSGRYQADVY